MAKQQTEGKNGPKEDGGKTTKLAAQITPNLDEVRARLGNSPDLITREYELLHTPVKVAIVYMDGITDKALVEDYINHAMSFEELPNGTVALEKADDVFEYMKAVAHNIGKEKLVKDVEGLLEALISGDTVILIEGVREAVSASTAGGEVRAVTEATTQVAIRGSKESFTETMSTNIALVRRIIKSADLWTETFKVGNVTRTDVTIMYMNGIANDGTVAHLRKELKGIDVDSILESGYIEQIIEENKFSPFPTIYNTERPDSVAGNLLDGRIAIFVDGTPVVLIAPTTFFMFFHSVEDYYQRFDISTLIRLLRFLCLMVSLFGPAVFVAALNFHQEMIPTPLLINLAAQREGVPFPTFVEALMMEVTFEIIREAGIRMPSPIGQTVSIIGGLVLGQAAVQAGIISPAMVIVVSLTGISSFATPAFNMALTVRMLRFVLMFIAAFIGLYGIAIFCLILVAHLCSLRSLGVPFMSPIAPLVAVDQKDTFIRWPLHFMTSRPRLVNNNNQISVKGKLPGKNKNGN